jgi:hypothetical protein
MYHTLTLNIGLAIAGHRNIGVGTVLRKLTDIGLAIHAHAGYESDTEPTLVVRVGSNHSTQVLGNLLFDVCVLLGQDCIAVVNDTTGAQTLIGPRAHKWLPFNPAYFLQLDGTRLA